MNVFAALADPTRRGILELLASSGQLSSTDISNNFSVSSPAISQHLKVLLAADLVAVEKQAQKRIYKVNPEAIVGLEDWVAKMRTVWENRFVRLDDILVLEKEKILKTKKERV